MAEDTAKLKVKVDSTEVLTADTNLDNFSESAQRAELATDELDKASKKAASGGMKNMRFAAGQLGFQVQDVAVQLQGGTNALTVLGQQGSQIASIFGPTGAIVGGIIAVGSAVSGVLVRSLSETTDELDETTKQLEEFESRIDSTRNSINRFKIEGLNADIKQQQEIVDEATASWLRLATSAEKNRKALGITKESIASASKELNDQATILQKLITQRDELAASEGDERFNRYITSLENEAAILKIKAENTANVTELLAIQQAETVKLKATGEELTDIERALVVEQIRKIEASDTIIKQSREQKALDEKRLKTATTVLSNLQAELDLLGKTNDEQVVATALRKAGVDAESDLGEEIKTTALAIAKQKDAIKKDQEEKKKNRKETDDLIKSNKALGKSATDIVDKLDPVGAKLRKIKDEIAIIQDATFKGLIDPNTAADTISKLEREFEKAGDESGNAFSTAFESAADSIGDSLQDAIVSGDWGGIGDTIAGVLANSVSKGVSGTIQDSLTQSFGDSIPALSGALAPIGGALAGGIVGSLVTGIGNLIGGDVVDPTEQRQEEQGTGSVLGSIDEKADSINASNAIIASATDSLVNINSDMLLSIRELNDSIGNITTVTAKAIEDIEFQLPSGGGTGLGTSAGLGLEALSAGTLGLSALFTSGSRSKQIDEGVQILGGQLTDLVDNTVIEAFATFKVRKNYLDDYDVRERFQALGSEVTDQFGTAFGSIVDTVTEGAKTLGIDQKQIEDALSQVTIDTQKISLEGLDDAATQAEFEAIFSKVFDDTVTAAIPSLKDLQRAGEGLGETLSRVSTEVALADEAYNVLGLSLLSAGDQTATIASDLIDKLGGVSAASNSLLRFERSFLSLDEQLSNSSRRLNDVLGDIATEGLPDTIEGFADLVQAQSQFNESGRQNIATLLGVQDEFLNYVGLIEEANGDVIESVEDVIDVIELLTDALDLAADSTDSALQSLKASVKAEKDQLSDIFENVTAERKEQASSEIDNIKSRGKSEITAINAVEKARLAAIAASKTEAKAIEKERLSAVKIALDAAKNGLSDITREVNGVSSALESLQSKTTSQEVRRAKAFERLNRALITGNLTGAGDDAAIAASIDASEFASAEDYRRQTGLTNTLLTNLEGSGLSHQSSAEKSIQLLEQQQSVIRATTDHQIAALVEQSRGVKESADLAIAESKTDTALLIGTAEEQLERELTLTTEQHEAELDRLDQIALDAQTQIDVLRGIDTSVQSVESAVSAFGIALQAEAQARKNLEAQEIIEPTPPPSPPTGVDTAAAIDEALSGGFFGLPLIQNIDPNIGNLASIPAFANGGTHSGGARIVGDGGGPELEFTGSSKILSNYDTGKALQQDEVIAEIASLRDTMDRILTVIAFDTRDVSKRLKRWDGGGIPNFRNTQSVEVV